MARLVGWRSVLALAAALLVATCGGATPGTPKADPLAGIYSSSGGGGALASVQALTKRFSELHPGVTFQVEETGSDAGINLAAAGQIDFGFTSRELKADELTKVKSVGIGLVGTGVIVNSANTVKNLSKEHVRKVFAGEISNWSELGGSNDEIKVFIREANAATRTNFEAYFFGGKATYAKTATEVNELEQTIKSVGSFRAAVGMATTSNRVLTDDTVRALSIDNIAPTIDNIVNGTYKIGRPLLIVYPADEATVKPAIKAFLDFVRSPEGQRIAASAN